MSFSGRSRTISPEQRRAVLENVRAEKMAKSHHAYVRGAVRNFYDWVEELYPRGLPQGPPVWICGDCHVGNLGPLADADGRIDILIRDLDQTVISNPAYDIVRLGLSLAFIARGSNLPGVAIARILEALISGYLSGGCQPDREEPIPEPAAVRSVRRKAMGRDWGDLSRERIGQSRPAIPRGRRFWPLSDSELGEMIEIFRRADVQDLVNAMTRTDSASKLELVDAAYWLKGCNSLGRLRYAALARVRGVKRDKFALIDFKEACDPTPPNDCRIGNNAQRVIEGARVLSPNLGQRMRPVAMLGKSVVIRELAPQDLKLEIEQFTKKSGIAASRYLGFVLGRAHGSQMSETDWLAWGKELKSHRSAALDAPGWLWSSVVDLSLRYEEAYLEHCRLYSLQL